ncbi:hypothetical protein HY489_01475 [Candidatus Woesearchaeota archaeon]|nr:hypothetical protein [Candidatus Woesearchaeota archaeon]
MNAILHVIHPYTYKLVPCSSAEAHIKQAPDADTGYKFASETPYHDRDSAVNALITAARNKRVPVVCHWHTHDIIQTTAITIMLAKDPNMAPIFEPTLALVTTPPTGHPIPDARPERIPPKRWDFWTRNYVQHTSFQNTYCGYKDILVIGGLLEACVAGFLDYSWQHRKSDQSIFCIEDACATFNPEERARIKPVQEQAGINYVNLGQGISILAANRQK